MYAFPFIRASDAEPIGTIPVARLPGEDVCPSLAAMFCPEIVRLINQYQLSDRHSQSFVSRR